MPDEVERYGAAAALVLAHIRYRCESNGPGRVTVAGVRWWRVSYSEFGSEVGLSGSAIRRALERLANSIEVAEHPPREDRRRSYKIASDQTEYESDKPASCHNTNPADHVPNSYDGLSKSTHPPVESDRCTTYRDLGEVTEEGGEAPTVDAELVDEPTKAIEQTGKQLQRISGVPADLSSIPAEPPRYCSRHMPAGTELSCGPCRDARHNYTRWEKRYGAIWDVLHPPPIGKTEAKALGNLLVAERLIARMDSDDTEQPPGPAAAPRYLCNRCRDRGIVLNNDGKPGRVIRVCHCDGGSHPAIEGELTDEQLAYARQLQGQTR
ncbi:MULTISPECIES: hypothetical protein [Mycobacterium]|nr:MULTISPECIES: hypothetical protein [Mycobacterium]